MYYTCFTLSILYSYNICQSFILNDEVFSPFWIIALVIPQYIRFLGKYLFSLCLFQILIIDFYSFSCLQKKKKETKHQQPKRKKGKSQKTKTTAYKTFLGLFAFIVWLKSVFFIMNTKKYSIMRAAAAAAAIQQL
jgi:hypothetical protein